MELCSFTLNDQPMSKFRIGLTDYDAFSGLFSNVNKRASACLANTGPIPPGQYYIIDRQSGGTKHRLKQFFGMREERDRWFGLYAADGRVDDKTWCEGVERGQFRLHPKGVAGISQGCIVINSAGQFNHIAAILRSSSKMLVPGIDIRAYGIVSVK
jgi:hypothetical protein